MLDKPGSESTLEVATGTPELEGALAPIEVDSPRRWSAPSVGVRWMIAGAFCFSVMSLLVKQLGQSLPVQETIFVRATITLILSWWAVRQAGVSPWGNNRGLLFVRGAVGYVALSCFYFSITHLPLADATVLQYMNPIFASILAVWMLRETLRARDIATVLISLIGVVLIARPAFLFGGTPIEPWKIAIGLAGAFGSGMAYVLVRRLRETEHVMVIVFYFTLISTVGSLPFAIPGAIWPTPVQWLQLLGVGVSTQLAQVSITSGLHLERAGTATAAAYSQVVFAAIWGAVFFAEYPTWATIFGATLIIGSTLFLGRRRPSDSKMNTGMR